MDHMLETEALGTAVELLPLGDMFNIVVSFASAGLLLGFLMLLIGLAVSGVVKRFKQA